MHDQSSPYGFLQACPGIESLTGRLVLRMVGRLSHDDGRLLDDLPICTRRLAFKGSLSASARHRNSVDQNMADLTIPASCKPRHWDSGTPNVVLPRLLVRRAVTHAVMFVDVERRLKFVDLLDSDRPVPILTFDHDE
jgi:hypothetical protein